MISVLLLLFKQCDTHDFVEAGTAFFGTANSRIKKRGTGAVFDALSQILQAGLSGDHLSDFFGGRQHFVDADSTLEARIETGFATFASHELASVIPFVVQHL